MNVTCNPTTFTKHSLSTYTKLQATKFILSDNILLTYSSATERSLICLNTTFQQSYTNNIPRRYSQRWRLPYSQTQPSTSCSLTTTVECTTSETLLLSTTVDYAFLYCTFVQCHSSESGGALSLFGTKEEPEESANLAVQLRRVLLCIHHQCDLWGCSVCEELDRICTDRYQLH